MYLAQAFVFLPYIKNKDKTNYSFCLDDSNWFKNFPKMHTTLGFYEK